MNKLTTIGLAVYLALMMAGCGATLKTNQASQALGVPAAELDRLCKKIECFYDELKGNLEAAASDVNSFVALAGNESRVISFSYVSGNPGISVDVYHVYLYGDWNFDEYAEIYIGKEMVAKIDGQVKRIVGSYNNIANEAEKIERIHGVIDFDTAEKIAKASPKTVTIRFYGQDGYNDVKPGSHNLADLVALARTLSRTKNNAS